jgi:hypothetical protein|tara:strand:- start:360 stop:686 length:327 start_codon:yes stop_codon:yes gene_type:complete
MAFSYHNITGSTGLSQELIAPGSDAEQLNSIVITNTAGTTADFSLFLQSNPESGDGVATETYYILRKVQIPIYASILIDDKALLRFDNNKYGLYISVLSGDTVDILIN